MDSFPNFMSPLSQEKPQTGFIHLMCHWIWFVKISRLLCLHKWAASPKFYFLSMKYLFCFVFGYCYSLQFLEDLVKNWYYFFIFIILWWSHLFLEFSLWKNSVSFMDKRLSYLFFLSNRLCLKIYPLNINCWASWHKVIYSIILLFNIFQMYRLSSNVL